MIFFYLFLSISRQRSPKIKTGRIFASEIHAEFQSTPCFQTNLDENESFDDLTDKRTRIVDITTDIKTQRQLEFFQCEITLTGNKFEENYAFGSGLDPGSGGVLFAYQSIVNFLGNLKGCNFSSNRAITGGAVCLVDSAALIMNVYFENNTAEKFGGSIYFEGNTDRSRALYIQNCTFHNNKAKTCGGALSIFDTNEIYMNQVNFKSNQAYISGGAIECQFFESFHIFNSNFTTNSIYHENIIANTNEPIKYYPSYNANFNLPFSHRGGGAISVKNDKNSDDGIKFQTNGCCFINDYVRFSDVNNCYQGKSHEILLDYVNYFSVSDFFYNTSDNWDLYVTKLHSNCIRAINALNKTCDIENFPDAIRADFTYSSPPSGTSTISGTSSVPEPSSYTYPATPITKLPKQTTSSYSYKYPSSAKFTISNSTFYFSLTTLTVRQTLLYTPHSTAHLTPHSTPHSTPQSSPVPTPSKSPDPTRTLSNYEIFTHVEVKTSTVVNTSTTTYTNTSISSSQYTFTYIIRYYLTMSETYILIESIYFDSVSQQKFTSSMIIGFATGGMFIFLIIAIIGIYLYRKAFMDETESYDSEISSETYIGNVSEGRTKVAYETDLIDDQITPIDEQSDAMSAINDDEAYMNNMDF